MCSSDLAIGVSHVLPKTVRLEPHGPTSISRWWADARSELVRPYFCDVLTSRHSRYRLRRFEPWASAQRLMARLEIEVFLSKSLPATCFQNHPISRNALAARGKSRFL